MLNNKGYIVLHVHYLFPGLYACLFLSQYGPGPCHFVELCTQFRTISSLFKKSLFKKKPTRTQYTIVPYRLANKPGDLNIGKLGIDNVMS